MGKLILYVLLLAVLFGSALALYFNNHIEELAWKQVPIIENLNALNDVNVAETMGDIKDYNKKTLVTTGLLKPLLITIFGLSLLTLFAIPFIGRKTDSAA